MPGAQRITKAGEVGDKINRWLAEAQNYADPESFRFKSLFREAERLAKADSFASQLDRALVLHLAGDLSGALYWLANASKQPSMTGEVRAAEAVIHSNLGHFSAAARVLESDPDFLASIDAGGPIALLSGAFAYFVQCAEASSSLPQRVTELVAVAKASRVSLEMANATEAQLRSVLDVAGEVLREHRLFFVNDTPVIRATDEGLLYQLRVGVSPSEAVAMTDEVIERLVLRDLDYPSISFSFISAAAQH